MSFSFNLNQNGELDWNASGGISHLKLMKGNEERLYEQASIQGMVNLGISKFVEEKTKIDLSPYL